MTTFLLVVSVAFGIAVGSFLNVVVYRVPAGLSVSRPRSACPGCRQAIRPRDNVPLVSWVLLRGRCRDCGTGISVRYPAVEALTGLLFAGAALRFGWSWTLLAVVVFFAGLVALAAVDLERYVLPKRIVYPTGLAATGLLVVAAAVEGQWSRLGVAGASAAVAFGLFYVLNWVNPRWLGFGDVRLAAVIGAVLGWLGATYVVLGLLLANVAGLLVIAALMATGRATRKTQIPYGVFLALGSVASVFLGESFTHLLRPS